MQVDFPNWKAFVERVIGGGGEEEEEADKTAVRGAERARKGDGAGEQDDLANDWGRSTNCMSNY